MYASHSPLTGTLKAAAYTSAAGELEGAHSVETLALYESDRSVHGLVGLDGVIARHSKTPAASHRGLDVGSLGVVNAAPELGGRA